MLDHNDLFSTFAKSYDARRETEMSLSEYLAGCRDDSMMYAGAPERILAAIGEPELVDTSRDPRFGRIFMNRTIRMYPAFYEFFGMEETIERIVSFFRHAAQGLEERKQILYLLGPVGGGRRADQPGVREPARAVRPRADGRGAGGPLRHPAPAPLRADEPVVRQ